MPLHAAHVLAVPPGALRRRLVAQAGDGEHLGVPRRIEEERERQAVAIARVAHPVGSGPVATARHALEHVAEVAHERAGDRRRVDPARRGVHLQPAAGVLPKHGEQPVVRVLGDAPVRLGLLRLGRVPEDAEQDQRIAREVLVEPARFQSEADGHAPHASR